MWFSQGIALLLFLVIKSASLGLLFSLLPLTSILENPSPFLACLCLTADLWEAGALATQGHSGLLDTESVHQGDPSRLSGNFLVWMVIALRAGIELGDEGRRHGTPVPAHPGTEEYLFNQ